MSTTYARTINGNTIYAAIADADSSGNSITNTYATKSEVQAIDAVPAVGSSDDGKVLKATYSGGAGSYDWGYSTTVCKEVSGNLIEQYLVIFNKDNGTVSTTAGSEDTIGKLAPMPGSGDNGKILQANYSSGSTSVSWVDAPEGVPTVGTGDDGKILVANETTHTAVWSAVAIPVIGTVTI